MSSYLRSTRKTLAKSRLIAAFTGIVTLCIASTASAAMYFTDEAAFLAAAPGLYVESFEELDPDNSFYLVDPDNRHDEFILDDFKLRTPVQAELTVWDYNNEGYWATDGIQYVNNYEGSSLIFEFDSPIKCFGVSITDFGDYFSTLLTFTNNIGDFYTAAVGPDVSWNLQFFGIITDTLFTRVTFSQSDSEDSYAIDEVYYGIPEPTTFSLIALGILLFFRRRH